MLKVAAQRLEEEEEEEQSDAGSSKFKLFQVRLWRTLNLKYIYFCVAITRITIKS